jgi:hypothetical protein
LLAESIVGKGFSRISFGSTVHPRSPFAVKGLRDFMSLYKVQAAFA